MGMNISYPLVHKPVYYDDGCDDDEGTNVVQQIHDINLHYCEDMINQRRHSKAAKKTFEDFYSHQEEKYAKVLKLYPEWKEDNIAKLKLQFMVTDINHDHLVDFNEFVASLDEMKEDSTMQQRQIYFQSVDTNTTGAIDFEQYLQVIYKMKKDGKTVEMKYSVINDKLQSTPTAGSEKAGVITKMDTFQQMCYKVF